MAPARPHPDEYLPYYGRYISLVPVGDIREILAEQLEQTLALLRPLSPTQAGHRYAEGKWSLKQVLGHMIDVERIFAFRALAIARGEQQPIPGFDQDDYMAHAKYDARTLTDLLEELAHLRQANLLMFKGFTPEAWLRLGTASGNRVSVRALAYIIAGHELHHRAIIQARYLAPKTDG